MDFAFEYFHFDMDSREKITAMKNLRSLHPDLMEIVVSELKDGNVISRVHLLGINGMEVSFRNPFHKSYERSSIEHTIETDPHYSGDFYRVEDQSVVAP
jgi:hypothetical protein